jgi:hypothetical protein
MPRGLAAAFLGPFGLDLDAVAAPLQLLDRVGRHAALHHDDAGPSFPRPE